MMHATLVDFLGWVAMQPHWKSIDVHEALNVPREHSPLLELCLFGGGDKERWLERLRLDEPLACREIVATRPIHEGFIAALEMVPARDGGGARAAVDAFFENELRREPESWLRRCYGRDRSFAERDVRFRGIDFPGFDNGDMGMGFGLMIDRDHRRWLWSCAAFFHK